MLNQEELWQKDGIWDVSKRAVKNGQSASTSWWGSMLNYGFYKGEKQTEEGRTGWQTCWNGIQPAEVGVLHSWHEGYMVCMAGRDAASYLHLSAPIWTDQNSNKKIPLPSLEQRCCLCMEQWQENSLTERCSLSASLPQLYAGNVFPLLPYLALFTDAYGAKGKIQVNCVYYLPLTFPLPLSFSFLEGTK